MVLQSFLLLLQNTILFILTNTVFKFATPIRQRSVDTLKSLFIIIKSIPVAFLIQLNSKSDCNLLQLVLKTGRRTISLGYKAKLLQI